MHATGLQSGDGLLGVRDFPAQNRELRGRKLLEFHHSQHISVGFEDECEAIVAHKLQSELPLVEFAGELGIGSGNKSDNVVRAKHVRSSRDLNHGNEIGESYILVLAGVRHRSRGI